MSRPIWSGEENRAESLATLALQIYDSIAKKIYSDLADAGFPEVRRAHSAVFRNIEEGGTRATTLAERAGIAKQSMAYLLEGLEEAGIVEYVPDPSDGRARLARLTKRGVEARKKVVWISRQIEGEYSQKLGEKRFAEIMVGLRELVDAQEDP